MDTCAHFAWLDVDCEADRWEVTYGKRLYHLVNDLAHPESQHVSIQYFIGKKAKTKALCALFTNNNITRRQAHGIGNLHVDLNTVASDHPVMFVDCTPDASTVEKNVKWTDCHEIVRHQLDWGDDRLSASADVCARVVSRVLFGMVDVVCVFVDDLGGPKTCLTWLQRWASNSDLSPAKPGVRPHLILIGEAQSDDQLLHAASSVFARVDFVSTGRRSSSPAAEYLSLKRRIQRHADEVCQVKRSQHALFRAIHLPRLFEVWLQHLAGEPLQPFALIAAMHAEKAPEAPIEHIARFIELAARCSVPTSAISTFVASACGLEGHPAGSHYFEPKASFRVLFATQCRAALAISQSNLDQGSDDIIVEVEEKYVEFGREIENGALAKDVHCRQVALLAHHWALLKSTLTCLWCIMRPPEHVLECGHTLCDTDVTRFGARCSGDGYLYEINTCMLCLSGVRLLVDLKPPTWEPIVLTIDGGGICGRAALGFIEALQSALGSSHPVQDYFDLILCTSSGALIGLDLCNRRSSVEQCVQSFSSLAKRIFPPRQSAVISPCAWLRETLCWWFADSRYDGLALEDTLKEVFGTDRRLFDVKVPNVSNVKLGVTATTTTDASLCVFTNYNGSRHCRKGYKHLRPLHPANEPYIWEIARCTSAAPGLFPPKRLPIFGPLQDGGLRANNPLQLALWELPTIWPSTPKPSVAVSVGTGYSTADPWTDLVPMRGIIQDGFGPRLLRSLLASPSLHGHNSWLATINGIEPRSRYRYHRLDVPLDGCKPEMDEPSQMSWLQSQVEKYLRADESHLRSSWAVRAASFYFELDRIPTKTYGSFLCQGNVLCRRSPGFVEEILTQFPEAAMVMNDSKKLGYLVDHIRCQRCLCFSISVSFKVKALSECVRINLRLARDDEWTINGFPHDISWFVDRQNLHAQAESERRTFGGGCRCSRANKKRRLPTEYYMPEAKH